MDRNTLSHYGWIVVCIMIIAVLLAFATPFGNFIGTGARIALDGFLDTNDKVLGEDHMNNIVDEWENEFIKNPEGGEEPAPGGSGDPETPGIPAKDLNPDDGSTPVFGDEYIDGDYEYRYGEHFCSCGDFESRHGCMVWWETHMDGWTVHYWGTDPTPPQILETINGEPVVSSEFCFSFHHDLVNAPKMPKHLITMEMCYPFLENLVNVPSFKDNYQLTNMTNAFRGCTSLQSIPDYAPNVKSTKEMFEDCTSLKTAPAVPSTVELMNFMFKNCTSLENEIEINSNAQYTNNMFEGVDFEAQKLTLIGTSSKIDECGNTGTNYCDICNGWCRGHGESKPEGVDYYYDKFYWGEVESEGLSYAPSITQKFGVVIHKDEYGSDWIYSFTQDEEGRWIVDPYYEPLLGGTNRDYYDDYGTHYIFSEDGKSIEYSDGWVDLAGTLTLDPTIPVNGVRYNETYVDVETGYTLVFTNDGNVKMTDPSGKVTTTAANLMNPYWYDVKILGAVYLEIDDLVLKSMN